MLTFDDRFRGVRDHALPVLERLGWPFTVFLVSGQIGGEDAWTRASSPDGVTHPLLDAEEIADMQRRGIDLQSHTCTHASLPTLDDDRLHEELAESRSALQSLLQRPVDCLAYPFLDMVNAARDEQSDAAYRPGHRLGNVVLTELVRRIFGRQLTDMLSGYRVLSRRFVKSFPALSFGFEIETELTVHALELRMPIAEVRAPYRERPAGSVSKLRTYRDGFRILRTIAALVKEERPLAFFAVCFAALACLSLLFGWPVVTTYLETGLVPRLPTAVLSMGLMLLAFLSLACGLILDTVTRGRRELRRLH